MSTTTTTRPTPSRKRVLCFVLGHRWARTRRSDHTVLLTCRRCGHLDGIDPETDFRPPLGWMGGGFGSGMFG